MSKFKVRLKIQNFELEVEGAREDIPLISQNIGNEIAGLLEPAANIVIGQEVEAAVPNVNTPMASTKPRHASRRVTSKNNNNEQLSKEVVAIDWVHSPEKWGTPQQSWKTAQKAIWLLFVAEKETGAGELSGAVITATFNKHFKQAKTITLSNTNRDLGKLKTKTDAPVSEDTTKKPSTWFLTQAGQKMAMKLVEEARGNTTPES